MRIMENREKTSGGMRVKGFVLLHIALLIYSTSGLFSKNASRHPFGSLPFILFYAGMIAVLGIYAILWQQVIKRMNVTTAYANKAVTVVWGVVLGILFFGEKISLRQVVACGVIILGTVLYVRADRAQEEEGSRKVQGNAGSNAENNVKAEGGNRL